MIALAEPAYMADAITLAYRTGMRREEIFGLTVRDVDYSHNFLMVRHACTEDYPGRIQIGPPKTPASKRRIDLDDICMDILRRRQGAPSDYIFRDDTGAVLSPWHSSVHFKRIRNKAGISRGRFHDLRHSHATILLANGVPPHVVKERLGHTSIRMTIDTYSYVWPTMQRMAVDVLNTI